MIPPIGQVRHGFKNHTSTGAISGAVYGNNQISCGGVSTTEWLVTQYKSSTSCSGAKVSGYTSAGLEWRFVGRQQPCQLIDRPETSVFEPLPALMSVL